MKLVSERIIIREFSYNDLDDYFEFAKNPYVGPMAGWKPVPSKDVARQILAKYMLYKDVFAICLKENNRVIGTMSIPVCAAFLFICLRAGMFHPVDDFQPIRLGAIRSGCHTDIIHRIHSDRHRWRRKKNEMVLKRRIKFNIYEGLKC